MDIRSILILLAFTVVSARTTGKKYEQVNKENIRNCLDNGDEDVKSGKSTSTKPFNISEIEIPTEIILKITNDTLSVSFKDNVGEERKIKSSTSKLIQYALIPAFFMSGIMPWIIPKLQMAVMAVSMMNNMVFSSALFSLIRNFVFEKKPDEHVIYINSGYKNKMPHRRNGRW